MRHPPFLEPARASNQRQGRCLSSRPALSPALRKAANGGGGKKQPGGGWALVLRPRSSTPFPPLCGSEMGPPPPLPRVIAPAPHPRKTVGRPHPPRCPP